MTCQHVRLLSDSSPARASLESNNIEESVLALFFVFVFNVKTSTLIRLLPVRYLRQSHQEHFRFLLWPWSLTLAVKAVKVFVGVEGVTSFLLNTRRPTFFLFFFF